MALTSLLLFFTPVSAVRTKNSHIRSINTNQYEKYLIGFEE